MSFEETRKMLALLMAKHSNEVAVPECRDGASQGRKHYRFDLWVMRRSWSPVTMIGYELKTTRSDFLADEKWQRGLELCHQFFFVCPHGLIHRDEVPAECGLIYVSKTWRRLRTMKRAPRREIELPSDLLVHVLMSRAYIVPAGGFRLEDVPKDVRVREIMRRLEDERERRATLAEIIREEVVKEWRKMKELANRAERDAKEAEQVREFLRGLGIEVDGRSWWSIRSDLRQRLRWAERGSVVESLLSGAKQADGLAAWLREEAETLDRLGTGLDDEQRG